MEFDKGGGPGVALGGNSGVLGGFSGVCAEGTSCYFDGATGLLGTPRAAFYTPPPCTVELWAWLVAQTTAYSGFLVQDNAVSGTSYLAVSAATGQYGWSMGSHFNNNLGAIDFNAWHHWVILVGTPIAGNANVTLYKDGALLDGPSNGPIASQSGQLTVGNSTGSGHAAGALIAEVATYSSVLSAARILDHYNAADTKAIVPKFLAPARVDGATPNLTSIDAEIADVLAAVRRTFP